MHKLLLSVALLGCFASAQAGILYSNGAVVDANGHYVIPANETTYGFTDSKALGYTLADDFTITGASWTVASLDLFAYQTNATGFTFTNADYSIRRGADINTATIVAAGTVSATNDGLVGYAVTSTTTSSTARAIYAIGLDIPDVVLSAGTYWLTWSIAGSSSFSGPFTTPVSFGAGADAMQSLNGGLFAPAADITTGDPLELAFQLNGPSAGMPAPVPEPGSIALLALGATALAVARRRRA